MADKKKVFISYGHNYYDKLINTLRADLTSAGDFEVFFDLECLKEGDWEIKIDNAISACDYFLFCVSAKSVSLEGYCMNELSRACELKKPVIPIILDDSLVPLSITRLQRLMFKNAIISKDEIQMPVYEQLRDRLFEILRGEKELGYYNDDFEISNALHSYDSYEIARHAQDFVGRERFLSDFESWIAAPNGLPIFVLDAPPGFGKTAISAHLCVSYPETVAGIHFCSFQNIEKTDSKNIITNLACQLAFRNETYSGLLKAALKRNDLKGLDPRRLFELLIIEPGLKIEFDTPQVLIIDALDEASDEEGRSEIAEILLSFQHSFPSWLRFFLTTRPQKSILDYFRDAHRFSIVAEDEDNASAIKRYYDRHLGSFEMDAETLRILMNKSHGSFLYAMTITRHIHAKELNLNAVSSFPDGIYSYYAMWFDRILGKIKTAFSEIRPVLALLIVCRESPSIDFLSDATKIDYGRIQAGANAFSSFFPLNGGCIQTHHKSILDWLSSPNDAPTRYFISEKEGYTLLLDYIKKVRAEGGRGWKRNPYVIRDYFRCLEHLELYDELVDLLKDEEYVSAVLKSKQLDVFQGLAEYVRCLKVLYAIDDDYAYEVYDSDVFRDLFAKERMRMYNGGLFIGLKEAGFASYLQDEDDSSWGIDGEIAKVFFHYISLDFETAKRSIDSLRNRPEFEAISPETRCEAERMIMLIYRKAVLFHDVIDVGPHAIEDARAAGNLFEESLANLTLSKVYCRVLDEEKMIGKAQEAIHLLSRLVDSLEEGPKKTENHLFLAEDYRVYADGLIWHGRYEEAKKALQEAENIYLNCKQHDRYYPRFLYTSLFLAIATHQELAYCQKKIQQIEAILEVSSDRYDMAQLRFFEGLLYYVHSKEDPTLLDKVEFPLGKAIDLNRALKVPLEAAEAETLYNLFNDAQGVSRHYTPSENTIIRPWQDYVEKFLKELRDHE